MMTNTYTLKYKFTKNIIPSIFYIFPPIALICLYFYSHSFAPFFTLITHYSPLPASTPTEIEKAYEKTCDYSIGKWVHDKREPLYNATTCSNIKQSLNCISNGRPNTTYQYWRWKPSECNLPMFKPNTFLNLIKNKQIAFVGDSLARNQIDSLICLLSTTSTPQGSQHKGSTKWYFPSHNANVSIYWSPFLVKGEQRKNKGPNYNTIFLDHVNEKWANDINEMDLVVLSFGHWFMVPSIYYEGDSVLGSHDLKFNYPKIGFYVPFRKALRTALNSIIDGRGNNSSKGNNGIDVIVTTYSPTHFEGDWDKGGTCSKSEPYENEEKKLEGMDDELRKIEFEEVENAKVKAKEFGGIRFEILDITKLALLRPDGHPGAYMNPFPFAKGVPKHVQNDCVHWCLPGPIDTWNEVFLETMKKWDQRSQKEK
ncbi:xyloglucan O-acetyltransferase 1-like [Cicer arietinum]|uniref:Protein ALTERED XYLOGLUCAN 4-like n=1 Tax=Cicer arietinum TaxID=3827 RepID=A0A3Q7Y7U8_CICAR|nr:protein ALTERED XYLOGLUCAN 4-like [Cicer arietinum]